MVDLDRRDVREEQERIGPEQLCQERSRAILVDDSLDPDEPAALVPDDRDPPPPEQITPMPPSSRCSITASSTISRGFGEATTRRHPDPSSRTSHPLPRASDCACASSYTWPTNFEGRANAGSSRFTTVWQTTAAKLRSGTALRRAWASQ